MENASKALLIAASVLVVILVVTFALRIFSSTNDVTQSTQDVGNSISSKTTSTSKKAIDSLKDLEGKNLINIKDQTVTIKNGHYKEYLLYTDVVLLEPHTTYQLSFDYKIIEKEDDKPIRCSIGCGDRNKGYQQDIIIKHYENQNIGEKSTYKVKISTGEAKYVTYGTETPIEQPYLRIRLVRMGSKAGNCKVEISNVRFVKVK